MRGRRPVAWGPGPGRLEDPGPRARASGSGRSHRTPLLSTSGRVWGGVVLTAPPTAVPRLQLGSSDPCPLVGGLYPVSSPHMPLALPQLCCHSDEK